jgi:hypothetical protein
MTPAPASSDTAAASASATPSTESTTHIAAEAASSLSLSIESTGGPVAGRFFQDIGSYAFTGDASGLDDGTAIEIYRRTAASGWTLQATTQLSGESYSATLPVRERGTFTFTSTTGGAPGSGDEISSNEVVITVEGLQDHTRSASGQDRLAEEPDNQRHNRPGARWRRGAHRGQAF